MRRNEKGHGLPPCPSIDDVSENQNRQFNWAIPLTSYSFGPESGKPAPIAKFALQPRPMCTPTVVINESGKAVSSRFSKPSFVVGKFACTSAVGIT